MLQLAEHARLESHGIAEAAAQGLLGNVTGEFGERLLQHGPADNQFPHQVEHAVNALGVHTQNVFREYRVAGLAGSRQFFPGLRGAPTIILCHGYQSSRGELLTLVSALQDHQYNVFVFDFAAHGGNAGTTTFGYREADEVRAAVDTIARRNDVDATRFGLWGYNLGAYAALREAEKDPRVRALVLDSVYDAPEQMVKIGVEKTGVGGFPLMVKSAQTTFEWLNYAYKNDAPVSSKLKQLVDVPILFIQAADDPGLGTITRNVFLKASEPREQAIIAHGNFVSLPDEEKRTYENRVVTFFLTRLPASVVSATTATAKPTR